MKVFLTPPRIQRTVDLARSFLRQCTANLMPLTQLLGLMVVNMEALQWGQLHTKDLQGFLRPYQAHIVERSHLKLQLPNRVRSSLCWWSRPPNLSNGKHLQGERRNTSQPTPAFQVGGASGIIERYRGGGLQRRPVYQ